MISTWTVEWFGTTTFRVRGSGIDLFFDGYLDRLPGLSVTPTSITFAASPRSPA